MYVSLTNCVLRGNWVSPSKSTGKFSKDWIVSWWNLIFFE